MLFETVEPSKCIHPYAPPPRNAELPSTTLFNSKQAAALGQNAAADSGADVIIRDDAVRDRDRRSVPERSQDTTAAELVVDGRASGTSGQRQSDEFRRAGLRTGDAHHARIQTGRVDRRDRRTPDAFDDEILRQQVDGLGVGARMHEDAIAALRGDDRGLDALAGLNVDVGGDRGVGEAAGECGSKCDVHGSPPKRSGFDRRSELARRRSIAQGPRAAWFRLPTARS
jgi:hypothetical protein